MAAPDPYDPDPGYVDPNGPNTANGAGIPAGPIPSILRRFSGLVPRPIPSSPMPYGMFAGIPLPKRLGTALAQFHPGSIEHSRFLDSMQEAIDIWDIETRSRGVQFTGGGTADLLKEALFCVLDRLSAIHPHDNCPFCAIERNNQKTKAAPDAAEADETSLFHWLMDNWSESKQNIVARLLRDYNITKKGK